MTDTNTLAPCPFCGAGTTVIRENGLIWQGMKYGEPSSVSVLHRCEATPGQPSRTIERVGKDRASAIAAWNRRAPTTQAAPQPAVQQGDALIDFIESAGSVHIYRVRAGLNGPIRWDIEYGYEDAKVSGRTLRDAISGVLKAGAASAAKEGGADAQGDALDAARYRYLKKYKTWDSTDVFYWLRCAPADEVDSIIDAARAQAQKDSND